MNQPYKYIHPLFGDFLPIYVTTEHGARCAAQWASLVARMVKNPPAMQETWVRSLGWEDPLEEGRHGNPLQCSCLENPHG